MDLKIHGKYTGPIWAHVFSNPISSPRIKVTTQFFFRIGFSRSESTRNFGYPVDLTVFFKNRGPEGGLPFGLEKWLKESKITCWSYLVHIISFRNWPKLQIRAGFKVDLQHVIINFSPKGTKDSDSNHGKVDQSCICNKVTPIHDSELLQTFFCASLRPFVHKNGWFQFFPPNLKKSDFGISTIRFKLKFEHFLQVWAIKFESNQSLHQI